MEPNKFDNERINEGIKNFLKKEIEKYGNFRFSYLLLDKKNNKSNPLIISDYPEEWVKFYKENELHKIDPVIIAARKYVSPLSWDDDRILGIKMSDPKVFLLSKKYNIINGYTFILHDNNYLLATLNLYSDTITLTEFEEQVNQNKANIQMTLMITHEKIISLYNAEIFSKKNKTSFTFRENEIIYWAGEGKTYSEIAIILNVKEVTIKYHMRNITEKLGVLNAKHAIKLSIELGLIKKINR